MEKTHVVFGAAGGLGSAIVRHLCDRGASVRAVVHHTSKAEQVLPKQVDQEAIDALDPDNARKACEDAAVVYHCINVPFEKWESIMPRVTDNILAAAEAAGASLLFPGNVFGYGPLQKIPATEDHPAAATTKKGRLRNALKDRLMEAHETGRVRVTIARFPDFYGPNVNNRLTLPLFRAAMSGQPAYWPGRTDVPHDMVFIEDAAAACVLLAGSQRGYGQAWHVPGPGPVTGKQFIQMVYEAAGTEPQIETVKPEALKFSGAAMADQGELQELMYLFEQPLVLDGSKFAKAFPSFRYTPHSEAISRTVEWFRQHGVL